MCSALAAGRVGNKKGLKCVTGTVAAASAAVASSVASVPVSCNVLLHCSLAFCNRFPSLFLCEHSLVDVTAAVVVVIGLQLLLLLVTLIASCVHCTRKEHTDTRTFFDWH